MLSYISVKNFAIIENIEVSFKRGMTSLTGETGAGKSLLIDAIGLLLGDRATSNVVRIGADKAVVEGIFHYRNSKIDEILKDLEIEADDHELHIKRQITQSNNNVIKINNTIVPLRELKKIANILADIHTQDDTHRLINTETYLDIIDGFHEDRIESLLLEYNESLKTYKEDLKEYNRLLNSSNDLNEKLDLYRYQKKEIESYQLNELEEDELKHHISAMKNFDLIFRTIGDVVNMIEQVNAIDVIYDATKELDSIVEVKEDVRNIKERMNSSYFELDDCFQELKDIQDNLDFDPYVLERNENRLNELDSIKRKYRKSIPEIIDYLDEITKDLNNIEHYDDVINDQLKQVENSYLSVVNSSKKITKLRKETALFIQKELLLILNDLELPNTRFEVMFKEVLFENALNGSVFHETGVDEVEFMLSTNIGEPLKSLSSSASGGEMSRIMLGFKNLLARSLDLSLIIFDEIDTGVSGFVAHQVAKKMLEISNDTQVLCITHIPQVASISNYQLNLYKDVKDGRTTSHIKELNHDERVTEIAKMISGDIVSSASIESAKELLDK